MNHKNKFQGIFVPVITPFLDNCVYEQGIKNLLEHLQAHNISGVWLLGSYGSFPLLSEQERMLVTEIALPKARELGMTVVVNVGSLYTDMAVHLAKHAQEHGADAVASVVPFYYAATHYQEHNFLSYFQSIVDSIQLPVFFYNNEPVTGFKPNNAFFEKMHGIGVHNFKSKGDYLTMTGQIEIAKKYSTSHIYFSGSTSVHLQGYLLGADGVTSGVAQAMPKLVTGLQTALKKNHIEEAVRLQSMVMKVRDIMGKYVGRAVACYDILKHQQVDVGTCRSPWLRMTPLQAQEIIKELQMIEEAI